MSAPASPPAKQARIDDDGADLDAALKALLTQSLNTKSDEAVVAEVRRLMDISLEGVKEWRDASKHKHSVAHILVNFNKQKALLDLMPALGQQNLQRQSDGCTPLHLSIWKRNLKLSDLLLDAGCDPGIKNNYNEDCLQLRDAVAKQGNIAFIDLELTAVPSDPKSSILEVAIVATDQSLVPLGAASWVVAKPAAEVAALPQWHKRTFAPVASGGNGLLDDVAGASALPLEDVAVRLLAFLREHFPERSCPFAGFSVHGDREVLKREMPEAYAHMSHQIIDVSTVVGLTSRWSPGDLVGRPEQTGKGHRAMSDVEHSIETLKFFKEGLWGSK